jgi:hypothetical protein
LPPFLTHDGVHHKLGLRKSVNVILGAPVDNGAVHKLINYEKVEKMRVYHRFRPNKSNNTGSRLSRNHSGAPKGQKTAKVGAQVADGE